jgi:exopolyphosphatase / guanosine-5'-triphosphate,3'-diphosphate pyrophosphatase
VDSTVLDLGSNTFHILRAAVGPGGAVQRRWSDKRLVRLGAGALATGWIDDAAWQRALCAVDELLDGAQRSGCTPPAAITAVATSVLREAGNGSALLGELARRFGLQARLLPPAEEARLAYLGARADGHAIDRAVVLDLGGGSLQIAVGDRRQLLRVDSLPLGVLRLRGTDVAAHVRAVAGPALAAVAALRPDDVVFAAGTARLLGRLGGESGRLTRARAADLARLLATLDPGALLELGVPPGRLDTVGPGAVAVAEVMALLGASSARIAGGGLREGLVVEMARSAVPAVAPLRRRKHRDSAVE